MRSHQTDGGSQFTHRREIYKGAHLLTFVERVDQDNGQRIARKMGPANWGERRGSARHGGHQKLWDQRRTENSDDRLEPRWDGACQKFPGRENRKIGVGH
jgi:hypothetical protein